jgi:hypothetical protein
VCKVGERVAGVCKRIPESSEPLEEVETSDSELSKIVGDDCRDIKGL